VLKIVAILRGRWFIRYCRHLERKPGHAQQIISDVKTHPTIVEVVRLWEDSPVRMVLDVKQEYMHTCILGLMRLVCF